MGTAHLTQDLHNITVQRLCDVTEGVVVENACTWLLSPGSLYKHSTRPIVVLQQSQPEDCDCVCACVAEGGGDAEQAGAWLLLAEVTAQDPGAPSWPFLQVRTSLSAMFSKHGIFC